MAIEQAIDQVQIARPAAAGADRELAGQMRFGARRECSNLLMPDMHPRNLALAPDRVGQAVEAVADNAVDTLDARCSEDFGELISNDLRHLSVSQLIANSARFCALVCRHDMLVRALTVEFEARHGSKRINFGKPR